MCNFKVQLIWFKLSYARHLVQVILRCNWWRCTNSICHKNNLLYFISCAIFILNLTTTTCLGRLLHARFPGPGSYASFSSLISRVTFSTNQRHVVRRFSWYLATRLVRYSVLIYHSRTHYNITFWATLPSRVATTIKLYIFSQSPFTIASICQRVAKDYRELA